SFSAVMRSGMQTRRRRCSTMMMRVSFSRHWFQRGSSKRVRFIGVVGVLGVVGEGGAAATALPPGCSVFGGEHDGDGGLWVVDVEGAAVGDELDQLGAGIVVADVEGEREA